MFKRGFSLFLVLALILISLPVSVWADTIVSSGNIGYGDDPAAVTWTLDSDGVLTLSGKGRTADASGSGFGHLSDSIKKIVIKEGIDTIGTRLFASCKMVEHVAFPDSLQKIDMAAFADCSALQEIDFPKDLKYVGQAAFSGCTSLTHVEMPNGVNWIHNLTGGGLFSGCTALSEVKLPDDMTFLGSNMFYGCTSLTHIDLPKGLTGIGAYSFRDTGLQSIDLHEGITSIGEYAFCSTPLKEAILPKSLKTLGDDAFLSCEQLEYVSIPDNTIKNFYAFLGCSALTELRVPEGVESFGSVSGCSSLESISLPSTLKTIGRQAFQNNAALTQLVIPDGVTSIGYNAFDGCSNLKDVVLPASFKADRNTVWCIMNSKTPHRTFHYMGSREQWNENVSSSTTETAIENGYITVIFDSTGEIGEPRTAFHIPANHHGFVVRDGLTGEPVVGASVSVTYTKVNGTSIETIGKFETATNRKGVASYERKGYTAHVEISADGYSPWNNRNAHWASGSIQLEPVLLWPESCGKYKLTGARWSPDINYWKNIDVLTTAHSLNMNSEEAVNSATFCLSCSVYNIDNVAKYELYQYGKKIATCSNAFGQFEGIPVVQFHEGGGCFVRVTTKDGQTADTPIRLTFVNNPVLRTEDAQNIFSLPDITIRAGDDIPYIGNNNVELAMPKAFPVRVIASEDKLQVAVNVKDFASGEDTEETQDDFKELEELVDSFDVYVKGTYGLDKYRSTIEGPLEAVMSKMDSEFEISGLVQDWTEAKVSLMGYLEGSWGESTISGKLVAVAKFKIGELRYNTIIGVVPVTANVKLKLSGTATEMLSINYVTGMPGGALDFSGKATMEAFAGVGFDKYVGVGAYGEAELELLVRLLGDYPRGLRKGSVNGELGLKGYFLGEELKKAFAEDEYVFHDIGDDVYPMMATSSGAGSPMLAAALYNASNYEPEDLSYLADSEGWTGGSASELDANLTEMKTLVSGVYRNAQPVMISTGDALIAAYVTADAGGNRQIALTKFDGSSWSAPVLVPGGTLDGSPALCMGTDGTVKLAFTRTTAAGSMKETAWQQRIVAGSVDAAALSFTQQAVFAPAGKSGFVAVPSLNTVNGQTVLAWLESPVTDDNAALLPPSSALYVSSWTGSGWSAAKKFCGTDAAIRSFAIGSAGGNLAAAYVAGGSLYRTTGSDAVLLAEGVSGKVSYGTIFASDTACFYWNKGNELVTENGTKIPAEGLSYEYQMTDTGLYYSDPSSEGSELTVVRAQGSGWSGPMQATADGLYLENLSVATMGGRDYAFGVNTTAAIREDSVEDSKDLVWARVTPIYGLRLDKVEYSEEGLAYKDKVTLTATVTNTGDAAVQYFYFLLDGDSDKPYSCNEMKVNLLPGETRAFDITSFNGQNLTYPNAPATHTLEALFFANDKLTDFDPGDNGHTFMLGKNDVALDLDYAIAGEQRLLLATVTNEGMEEASGTVTYYDSDGSVLGRSSFSGVEPGGIAQMTCTFGGRFAAAEGGVVRADAAMYGEDFYSHNNSDSVYVEPLDPGIAGFALEDQTLGATVLMQAGRNGHVLCAFYDANGRMIAVDSADLQAGLNSGLSFVRRGSAATAKLFVITDGAAPLFAARELKLR